MKELIILLFNLNNRQALAILRANYPCAFLLPGFLAGQSIIQFVPTPDLALFALITVLLALTIIFKSHSYLINTVTISAACGIFSAILPFLPLPQDRSLFADQSYLAQLYKRPRYIRTNQASFSLKLLAQFNHSDQQFIALEPPLKVSCSASHLPWKNSSRLRPNSVSIVKARFRPLLPDSNPFSFSSYLRRQGYHSTCRIKHLSKPLQRPAPLSFTIREYLIKLVWSKAGDQQASGVLLAMTLGVRDLLTIETENSYKRLGLAHLLVVSGYHISLVFLALLLLPRLILCQIPLISSRIATIQLATPFALIITLSFVWLVGLEGSSMRAGLAVTFVALARSLERGGGLFNGICTSLLLMSLIWPGCFLDAGIQLTYAALLGINLGLSYKVTAATKQLLIICFFASLLTGTITLWHFNQLSLVGFILNPLLAPTLALLGCKLGLVAIGVALTEIEFSTIPLELLVAAFAKINQGALWLSDLPLVAISAQGASKTLMLTLLILFISKIVCQRLVDLLLSLNLLKISRS